MGSRSKLSQIDYTKFLTLCDVNLDFVDTYKYLGTTLDKEMNLTGLLSDVKKSVLNKSFVLCKLRSYITEKCSLLIYKQTILPRFDYVGFMLLACNKSDRHDLQVIQNDILRTCYNVKRRDRLSVSNMHNRAHLLSSDQRREIELLGLIYSHKGNPDNMKIPIRNTERQIGKPLRLSGIRIISTRIVHVVKVLKTLPLNLTRSECITQFKMEMRRLYSRFRNDV